MPRSGRVTGLNRTDRCLYKTFKELLDILVQTAVLESHGSLAGEGGNDVLLARLKTNHLLTYIGQRYQLCMWLALSIDQLQYPDDHRPLVPHRNSKDRFSAISRVFVEPAIDRVRHIGRKMIGIFDIHDLARRCHVTRNGSIADLDSDLAEGNANRIVLC